MAWVRVGPGRERLVNLDGFVHIQVVATGDADGLGTDGWVPDDGRWVLEGILRDRSSARLLEGSRAECQALLEEVAQAVWAIGVGVTGERGPVAPTSGRFSG